MAQDHASETDYSDLLNDLRATQQPAVLAVDDDPGILRLVEHILRNEPLRLSTASTAKEAWHILKTCTPDLVLLDIDMPEIDGYALCKAIREQPRLENVRIIFLTAHAADNEVVIGLDLGADDYITKPFDKTNLIARVHANVRD